MSQNPGVTAADVRLIEITRRWGASTALDGVSLEVAAGSFCVLLGPSGCGKTTCLRIVAGLDAPTTGRVEIGGRDVTTLPPAARGIAMVFQSYALFPHLSVAENIMFGLKARSVPAPERRRRLDRAVEILGIGALLQRRPGQLSGGQQQRVALGRAIVAEAPVCLMDEPLSNLDAQLRAEMRREILALQRRLGITMLYVTHDQTEAMGMADQVVLLRGGRIEQDAPPAELYATPATRFTASFIGTPPMNLLERGNEILGIRPEHVRLAESGLPAQVIHAEYLGADTILSCELDGQTVLARLPGRVQLAAPANASSSPSHPASIIVSTASPAPGWRRASCTPSCPNPELRHASPHPARRRPRHPRARRPIHPAGADRDEAHLLLPGRRRRPRDGHHRRLLPGIHQAERHRRGAGIRRQLRRDGDQGRHRHQGRPGAASGGAAGGRNPRAARPGYSRVARRSRHRRTAARLDRRLLPRLPGEQPCRRQDLVGAVPAVDRSRLLQQGRLQRRRAGSRPFPDHLGWADGGRDQAGAARRRRTHHALGVQARLRSWRRPNGLSARSPGRTVRF